MSARRRRCPAPAPNLQRVPASAIAILLSRPALPRVNPAIPTDGQRLQKTEGGWQGKTGIAPSSPTLNEIRRRHVALPVKVREGGRIRDIHVIEALDRQIDKMAFAGGIQAARLATERHEQTMLALEAEYQENMAWMTEYCARYCEAAAYDRAGKPVPDWIARPEDIHCSREDGLRIIGSYSPETLENLLLARQWRDALFVKMIHDEALFFWRPGVRITLAGAESIVYRLDHLMPKRWKLASPEMREREAALIWATRPQLLRKLEEAFEPLGLKGPIKTPAPPVPDKVLRILKINPKHVRTRFAKREAG